MKKNLTVLGLTLAFVVGISGTVCAAGETPTATFDGSQEITYNYDDTGDFGSQFADMLPGEEKVQEIILENKTDRSVEFHLRSQVLKAFEDTKQATGAAYQISLTISKDGNTELIYGGNEADGSARIGADANGLKDMNKSLKKWFLVATLPPQTEASLKLSVYLDGESHTNDYQSMDGTFQFEFQAGYEDAKTQAEIVIEKRKDTIKNVKTKDATPYERWIGMGAAALLAMTIVMLLEKRRGRATNKSEEVL